MAQGFQLREGTYDDWIFRSVVEQNEYGLPDAFGPDDLILDVGAHIGSFGYAAATRGARRIEAFEADEANFRCARANLKPFGRGVRVHHRAVWRSDRGPTTLTMARSDDPKNTGGGNVWSPGAVTVRAEPFDRIVRRATRGGRRRVRLLKIDCEGSEFPILFTSKTLHLIDEIAGEYHEFGGAYDPHTIPEPAKVEGYARYTIAELTEFLQRSGFAVESKRYGDSNFGVFRARSGATGSPIVRRPWVWGRVRSLLGR